MGAAGTNETNAYRRTERDNTMFCHANQYSRTFAKSPQAQMSEELEDNGTLEG